MCLWYIQALCCSVNVISLIVRCLQQVSHARVCRAFVTRWGPCMPISQSTLPFRRTTRALTFVTSSVRSLLVRSTCCRASRSLRRKTSKTNLFLRATILSSSHDQVQCTVKAVFHLCIWRLTWLKCRIWVLADIFMSLVNAFRQIYVSV